MVAPAVAQSPCARDIQRTKPADTSIYAISEVTDYSVPIATYSSQGKTKIAFEGTSRMPDATGDARIESQKGYTRIDANFNNFQPACTFGADYLTYVLWAITPEGRASNLGEVLLGSGKNGDRNGDKGRMDVTTDFQTFGLMVTAEPHFAVSRPSNVVVLQNVANVVPVAGCNPCAQQGGSVAHSHDKSGYVKSDSAKSDVAQAGEDVAEKSEGMLSKGGNALKKGVDVIPGVHIDSDNDTQTHNGHSHNGQVIYSGSDSHTHSDLPPRFTVVQAQNAIRIATSAGAETYASDTLAKAKSLLSQAQVEDINGAYGRSDALARESAQTAEDARIMSVRGAMMAAIKATQAELEARLKAAETVVVAEAVVDVDEAMKLADAERELRKAEDEKAALRAKLAQQLSMIMVTRDTVRGLIVDMADVRFPFDKHELKSEDREKLSKVSGILLAYPGLTIEVEGFTDNVGTTPYNQNLSEQRAQAVRDFLIGQGIPAARITARGLGETQPLASNDTPEGRQQNRRVELIVAGEAIGTSTTIEGIQ
jgi:outer membrane protein OmpA-like peptidoglycan-associated protein